MKTVLWKSALFFLVASAFLTACSEEYLDMSTSFRSDLCVVKARPGKPVYLLSDKGGMLHPISELDSTLYKPGSRYLVTYIVLDSSSSSSLNFPAGNLSVRIKEMQTVLTKTILKSNQSTPAIEGNDPVRLLSIPWLAGGYLNLELMFRFDNKANKHSLWMVHDTTLKENGSLNTYLTFLHNANGDEQTNVASILVSFDYAGLEEMETADSLIVRVREWNNDNQLVQKQYRIRNTTKRTLSFNRSFSGIQ